MMFFLGDCHGLCGAVILSLKKMVLHWSALVYVSSCCRIWQKSTIYGCAHDYVYVYVRVYSFVFFYVYAYIYVYVYVHVFVFVHVCEQ